METRRVRLVDAFATEPTGGVPVAVLPDGDDLTDGQLRAAASELGTAVVVPSGEATDRLRVVGTTGSLDPDLPAVVAAFGTDDGRDPDGTTVETPTDTRRVELGDDGRVWTDQPAADTEQIDIEYATIGEALSVDAAALRDVGADLPPLRVAAGATALAVPVNFLEHLAGASPRAGPLSELCGQADVDAVLAFTFDTLGAEAACHVRTYVPPESDRPPRTVGLEAPASPSLAAGVVTHLVGRGTIEGAESTVETGRFCDRPGLVDVRAGARQVGGRAVASLDGRVTLPAAGDDDIIEA